MTPSISEKTIHGEFNAHIGWLGRFSPRPTAKAVAVLRIVTGVAAFGTGVEWVAGNPAGLPRALWRPPRGWQWAVDTLPINPTIYQILGIVFLVLVTLVIVGYRTRVLAGLASLSAIYLGLIPHFTGKVDHYHHIVWFLVLVALAPADDALSLRKTTPPASDRLYASTLLSGILLLGIVYLSAGIPKLLTGPEWIFSDNMRNLVWNLWWEKDHWFQFPIGEWPFVYQAMALGAVAFELLFLPAALVLRTRRWALWAGLGFHLAIWILIGINFWALAIFYVVLVDWGSREHRPRAGESTVSYSAPLILASAIAIAVGIGLFQSQNSTWPIAGYPSFAGVVRAEQTSVLLQSVDGTVALVNSALADQYGAHRVRSIASTAIGRDLVPLMLQHTAELAGRPDDYYTGIELVAVPTQPSD